MVHRDPETGQFVSHDGENLDLNYADHEFVNARIVPRIPDSSPQGAVRQLTFEIEDTVLNLDNDELGMLSWMNASMASAVSGFSQDQDSNGSAQCIAEIGANLSDADYLAQPETTQRVTTLSARGATEARAAVANDEPGLWGVLNTAVNGGYKDLSGDGGYYSANSVPSEDRIRREFYAETMNGPYIDSTDSINVGFHVNRDSMGAELLTEICMQMSFIIFEYDQVRSQFGPVPGGISR